MICRAADRAQAGFVARHDELDMAANSQALYKYITNEIVGSSDSTAFDWKAQRRERGATIFLTGRWGWSYHKRPSDSRW